MPTSICVFASDKFSAPDPSNAPFGFEIHLPLSTLELLELEIEDVFSGYASAEGFYVGVVLRNVELVETDSALVIVGDPAESEFVSADYDAWLAIANPLQSEVRDGLVISILEDNEREAIHDLAKSRWKISFGAIPNLVRAKALEYVPRTASSLSALAKTIEIGLRRNFATDQLHLTPGDRITGTPYNSAAFALAGYFVEHNIAALEPGQLRMPNVDLGLRVATIDDFKARIRTSRKLPSQSQIDAIEVKLERAEKRHQEILEDCANYLSESSITPLVSESADLAYTFGSNLTIYEIKSATGENFDAQFEKGLLQVARYRWEFSPHYSPIRACLIMEKPPFLVISENFFEFAESLDIELLLWDELKGWPFRVPSLIKQNFSYLED